MRQFCLTSAARFCASVFLFLGLCLCAHPVLAQKQEVTLSLGGIFSQSRSFYPAGATQISGDYDLEANYGYRFLHANIAALYGEIEFVALPNRRVTTATAIVPKNYASLFAAPGVRLKFAPVARISPWVAIGGGYALNQQSAQLSNGHSGDSDDRYRSGKALGSALSKCKLTSFRATAAFTNSMPIGL